MEQLQSYLLPLVFILFFGYRFFRFHKIKKQIPILLKEGAVIVDVRSVAEFQSSANPISINAPLDSLIKQTKHLDKNKTIIVCCASGTRSSLAVPILKGAGFNSVINAGAWTNTIL